jgi:hypothetical protein
MQEFWNAVFFDGNGKPKQGHEYRALYQKYNTEQIGVILRWRDGKLNDDGELPAVEFQDTHIEHYRNGLLHNENKDGNGKMRPAIVSAYGSRTAFYIDGKPVFP